MAELDGPWLAAVLPTNANFQSGANRAAPVHGEVDQAPNALLIEDLKWVIRQNSRADVGREKPSGVIATQAKCRLRQVIGAEGKELSLARDLVSREGRSRKLDHRSDGIGKILTHPFQNLVRHVVEDRTLVLELLERCDEWNHDLRADVEAAPPNPDRGLENRTPLHFSNLGERDTEPASAVSEHRVCFAQ